MAPSPVNEVYEQIIADLTYAAENLPTSFDAAYVVGHANSGAAHAMLAKIYLKAAGYPLQANEINGKNPYQAAKEHCRIIMEELGHDLNSSGYKDVFLNLIQNRYELQESLFELSYRNGEDIGAKISGRVGYFNGLFYNVKLSKIGEPTDGADMTPAPIHESIYEEGDMRKSWNVPGYSGVKNQWSPNGKVVEAPNALNWTYTIGKFRRWDAAFPDDIDKSNEQLQPIINELGIQLHCVKVEETENNFVEYYGN